MTTMSPPQGAQAAIRTIRLLKAFTAEQPELSLNQLSERIGLNKTTAHRLLAALESESLVEKSTVRGNYRLGPGTVALGAQAQSSNYLRMRVRPSLERLARMSQETTSLEVLLGSDVLMLDEVDGGRMVKASGFVGTRWPAHATSTGKAILARLNTPYTLTLPLIRLTDRTITDTEKFQQELTRVRKRGYATVTDELESGYSAVSVAIAEQGVVRAALSIGGPTVRFKRERCAEFGNALIREVNALEQLV